MSSFGVTGDKKVTLNSTPSASNEKIDRVAVSSNPVCFAIAVAASSSAPKEADDVIGAPRNSKVLPSIRIMPDHGSRKLLRE